MPELTADARPVCALLYPTNGLREHARQAGELDRLLGPGAKGASMSGLGQLVRVMHPGAASLGVLWFDWEAVDGSPFGAKLGRLKCSAEIKALLAEHGPKADKAELERPLEGMRAELWFDVCRFREAVGG